MNGTTIGILCVGALFSIMGYLFIAKQEFAEWGLRGRRGKIWVNLLGQERALKLTRYFFGPLLGLAGLFCIVIALASQFL